ncbi:MAG: hypothetical protein CENE_01708 [Candidatus Celerinatantimonas neptuna]|nr:MAG: hypothetical protein CENE_01708 [Candidatus Celerinatantimonas neptuna]
MNGVHSKLEAPLIGGEPVDIQYSFIQGKMVIDNGQVQGLDKAELVANVRQGVQELLYKES